MHHVYCVDLQTARKKSGLTQDDLAHLLGTSENRVSKLEHGRRPLSVSDIASLTLIYGKPFESLFAAVLEDVARTLPDRIASLPPKAENWFGQFNREHTLSLIANRLLGEPAANDGGFA
ncbi:MAG: helix-turn-helix transcriptional regulator [Pseudomonadota bacterium]